MIDEDYLEEPNRYEILEIWIGLPLKEKLTMILKQIFPKM